MGDHPTVASPGTRNAYLWVLARTVIPAAGPCAITSRAVLLDPALENFNSAQVADFEKRGACLTGASKSAVGEHFLRGVRIGRRADEFICRHFPKTGVIVNLTAPFVMAARIFEERKEQPYPLISAQLFRRLYGMGGVDFRRRWQ